MVDEGIWWWWISGWQTPAQGTTGFNGGYHATAQLISGGIIGNGA
jgi:hypothetical protein